MSEKKDNKDLFQNSSQRRRAKEDLEKKATRKTRITALIIVLALVIVSAGAILINSNFLRRNAVAVTVGDVKFSAAEFDYFYYSAYQEYASYIQEQLPDLAASILPNRQFSFKSQVYDPETGETWADVFQASALESMQQTVKIYAEAKNANHTLSDEEAEKLNADIENLSGSAILYGYTSFDQYLTANYGRAMTQDLFRELMTIVYTANSYASYVNDAFTYTNEALDKHYDENADRFDIFTYRYFLVNSETPEIADDATEEEKEAANAEALAAAGVRANEIMERIEKSGDIEAAYIEEARNYNPESYAEADSTLRHYNGEILGSPYGDWLREPRTEGDLATFEITTGYYVVYFGNRSANDYETTSMRQILVKRDDFDLGDYEGGEDDPAYLEAFKLVDNLARTEADAAYAAFIAAGATEEKLLELMPEYSDDQVEGGLYEGIYKWQMVPEVNDWLFAPARKVGDSELVRTESYGYHLMYFMGTGREYRHVIAESDIRKVDYDAWATALPVSEATTHWALRLAK